MMLQIMVLRLHEEIKDFYEYMSQSAEEINIRNEVVQRIKDVVEELWPEAKMEAFGSFRTGLWLPTSDIDLVVDGSLGSLPLFDLHRALINKGYADPASSQVIAKAKVPIIKMIDLSTKVKVDISLNNHSSIEKTDLICKYVDEFPNLKYLFLVLKQFLLQRDLNEVFTGGISSYCLFYLTVSFFQLHPRSDVLDPNANLGVLLVEFFELYGRNFNYHNTGIKIKDGGCYVKKTEIQGVHNQSFLCIEDPWTKEDIGRIQRGACQVMQAFKYAYLVMNDPVAPSFVFAKKQTHSILGRIIRVTNEVVEYRQWIRKTFPCEIVENNQVDSKSRSYASVANSSKTGGSKADIIDNSKKCNEDESRPSNAESEQSDGSSVIKSSTSSANDSSTSRLTSDTDSEPDPQEQTLTETKVTQSTPTTSVKSEKKTAVVSQEYTRSRNRTHSNSKQRTGSAKSRDASCNSVSSTHLAGSNRTTSSVDGGQNPRAYSGYDNRVNSNCNSGHYDNGPSRKPYHGGSAQNKNRYENPRVYTRTISRSKKKNNAGKRY